jgi:hypothetical protein
MILGQDLFNSLSVFGLETLPWAARLEEFGKKVDILGTKFEVDLAVTPENLGQEVRQTFIAIYLKSSFHIAFST